MAVALSCAVFTGCQSAKYNTAATASQVKPIMLREADVIRISFPGNPNFNTTTTIRRDGKIALDLVGEVQAAGLTPAELRDQLIKLYSPHLIEKEVNVFIESSSYPVFLTGAVLRPGKITANRPLSVLEAIMEAGGVDYSKANLKNVRVLREVNGRMQSFNVDVRKVLRGEDTKPFYLMPSDIVFVPERFVWF